jgi:hypothetical protein
MLIDIKKRYGERDYVFKVWTLYDSPLEIVQLSFLSVLLNNLVVVGLPAACVN